MANRSVITNFGGLSTYRYGVDSYDSTKLGLGPLIYQRTGVGNEDKFIGPAAISVARPMEQSTAIPGVFPWAMRWQNDVDGEIDWIFLADNAAAAATRRIVAYTYNRRLSEWTWKGFILITFPSATNYIIRGMRMTYDLEYTGTIEVSGTTVTGTSTLFSTNKVCVGNRIGFGSTDPTEITTWYQISGVGSDTGITLSASAGTISSGTSYVIEDLRCVLANTNATTTNGGLFVIKGLSFDAFSTFGTAIPAATTVDNIRASYWLADASTVTNTVSLGLGIAPKTSPTSQFVYVLDTIANPIVFKYNIRANLTVASGKSTDAFVYKTGAGGALTGAASQLNNGRLATAGHGTHSGIETLYFTTTTRVYAAPTSGITTGSTTWLSSGSIMTEVPPGGASTFSAGGVMQSIEYIGAIDKFVICSSTSPTRSYITEYRTDASQLDRIFGCDIKQIDQSGADSSTAPIPSMSGASYSSWGEGGLCYLCTTGITAILNRMYAVPFGADWEYTGITNSRAITPEITLTDCEKFVAIIASQVQVLGTGGSSGHNLGLNTEPFRIYYRTSGISDDSGSWTLLDSSGLFTDTGTSTIQLMFEFKTIGTLNLPARICNAAVLYKDSSTDDEWLGSQIASDVPSATFGFYFKAAYGSVVPRLRFTVKDSDSGSILYTDDSITQDGTWEKSTDGGSNWVSYNTTDRGNATTYVRIQPSSIASGVKAIASLRTY
jgi:hypothetical protein